MSSYTSFIKLTTISADEMNNNFNHCFSGDWLPLSGATLTTDTTETLDMGSQTDAWNNLYCNNLNIDGEIKNAFNLIAEVTLSSTVSAIEFTNLDGDKDETWLINSYFVLEATTASSNIGYQINGDSAANYGLQKIDGINGSVSSSRFDNGTRLVIGRSVGTSASKICYSDAVVYCKSGNDRLSLAQYQTNELGSYVYNTTVIGGIWNNTTDTITNLQIIPYTNLLAGTNIQIWAKTTTITSRSITITET